MTLRIEPTVVQGWSARYGCEIRGEGDRSLDAIDDTNSFALLVRRSVDMLRPRTVLDVGCGCGIPTLEAARSGAAEVYGIDIDSENVRLARRNVARAGYSHRIRLWDGAWQSIAQREADLRDVNLLVSNPPYVPGGVHSTVGGGIDGTRMLRSLVTQAPPNLEGISLLFSSLSNPLAVLGLLESHGWRIGSVLVHAVPFARYTSAPSTLRHLLALRRSETAYFSKAHQESVFAPYEYLLLGVVAVRTGMPVHRVAGPLRKLLRRFQREGVNALGPAQLPVPTEVASYLPPSGLSRFGAPCESLHRALTAPSTSSGCPQ